MCVQIKSENNSTFPLVTDDREETKTFFFGGGGRGC